MTVIGDKKAGASTRQLMAQPELLDHLRQTVGKPVKVIHTIRNPYDNIGTMCRMNRHTHACHEHVETYFDHVATCAELRKTIPIGELYEVRNEELISDPAPIILELCEFLGVPCPPEYHRDATSSVFQSPNPSRFQVQWNEEMIESVRKQSAQYDFLSGYTYDDGEP